jgi:hypothetical protein
MRIAHLLGLLVLGAAGAIVGCGGAADRHGSVTHKDFGDAQDVEKVKASLALLSPEDRKVAEAQKVCPVSGEALGSMGTPYKVELEGQPVFLCCDGCLKKARDHAHETLAKAQELKAKAGAK